ncbi:hypothetical protein BDV96DRAFT_609623 [Lophiotrema nucula]|uniref:SGNH hydrolase-type esterase domain-containing protein n=1 Tax=Lophiotrema nucula TaxID=690887 RepID=A0A6A5ZTJ9_9PLEO|nr:hypothetical protein BDV96DRAFT_609623 [Lophiotrema nucula]
MSKTARKKKIGCSRFYQEWKGHPIEDLSTFRDITLAQRPDKPMIYLAGDSSLDNKAWVPSSGPGGDPLPVEPAEIYHQVLDKPRPKPDVAFWLNHMLGERATTINSSVEASMLRERNDTLLPHDEFIRDNIRPEDILIVSIGGNDVALRPSLSTIAHMLQLAWLTRRVSLENGSAGSLKYFQWLFGTKVQDYITRIVSKQKPKAVIVCMIYFPLESGAGPQQSWAEAQLKALGYNRWPSQLQTAIKRMYEIATCQIKIEGTQIIPCPLYEVLDGKTVGDYTARVEPSVEGGRKMAEKFVRLLGGVLDV